MADAINKIAAVTRALDNYATSSNDSALISPVIEALYNLGLELQNESSRTIANITKEYGKTVLSANSSALTRILVLANQNVHFQQVLHNSILSKYKNDELKKLVSGQLPSISSPLILAIKVYSTFLPKQTAIIPAEESIASETQQIAQAFIEQQYKLAVLEDYKADCEEYYQYLKYLIREDSSFVLKNDECQPNELLTKESSVSSSKTTWENYHRVVMSSEARLTAAYLVSNDLTTYETTLADATKSYMTLIQQQTTVSERVKTLSAERDSLSQEQARALNARNNAILLYDATSRENKETQEKLENTKTPITEADKSYRDILQLRDRQDNIVASLKKQEKELWQLLKQKEAVFETTVEARQLANSAVAKAAEAYNKAQEKMRASEQNLTILDNLVEQKKMFFLHNTDKLEELETFTKAQLKNYTELKEKCDVITSRIKAYTEYMEDAFARGVKPGVGFMSWFSSSHETREKQYNEDLVRSNEQEQLLNEQLIILKEAQDKERKFKQHLEELQSAQKEHQNASDEYAINTQAEQETKKQLGQAQALAQEKDSEFETYSVEISVLKVQFEEVGTQYTLADQHLKVLNEQLVDAHKTREQCQKTFDEVSAKLQSLQLVEADQKDALEKHNASLVLCEKLFNENEQDLNDARKDLLSLSEPMQVAALVLSKSQDEFENAKLAELHHQESLVTLQAELTEAKKNEGIARKDYITAFKATNKVAGILWEKFESMSKLRESFTKPPETKVDTVIIESIEALKEAIPIIQQERDSGTMKFLKGVGIFLGCFCGITEAAVLWSLATKQCLWRWSSPKNNVVVANSERLALIDPLVEPSNRPVPPVAVSLISVNV